MREAGGGLIHGVTPVSPFPLLRLRIPALLQTGRGGLCSGDPHELSFLGVASPPAPLGSPNPDQGAASPKFRLSWRIAAPELPKSPGLRCPLQPQTGGSREGKPPEEGNFPLLASHSLRATRGISVHDHLRRIPSFLPPVPARRVSGGRSFQSPRETGSFSRLREMEARAQPAPHLSFNLFFWIFLNGLFALREAPAGSAGRGEGEPRLCGAARGQLHTKEPILPRLLPIHPSGTAQPEPSRDLAQGREFPESLISFRGGVWVLPGCDCCPEPPSRASRASHDPSIANKTCSGKGGNLCQTQPRLPPLPSPPRSPPPPF